MKRLLFCVIIFSQLHALRDPFSSADHTYLCVGLAYIHGSCERFACILIDGVDYLVTVGQSFAGHKVHSISDDVIVLVHDNVEQKIPVKKALQLK